MMKNVKCFQCLFLFATLMTIISPAYAQTAVPMLINYQGELRDPVTGDPVADGSYDMVFRICEAESGGAAFWEGTHTAANGNAVQVANGRFSVILGSGAGNELDSSVFNGPDRWLEIEVGGETLSPRQRITSTAFSIVSENNRLLSGRDVSDFAEDGELATAISAHAAVADVHHPRYTDAEAVAAMGSKTDENPLNHDKTMRLPWGSITDVPPGLADGEDNDTTYTAGAGLRLLDSQFNVVFDGSGAADTAARSDHHHNGVYSPQAHEHDAADIVSGTLSPARFSAYEDLISEGHLDNIDDPDLMTLGDAKARFWSVYGNNGTNPASHFVGTLDEQALELRVNGERALRLEPGASPNVIGGYMLNRATDGVIGATVSGGGETGLENRVSDSFGTVGGGRNNQVGDDAGTVNDKPGATVGGGAWNIASGRAATVGGGLGNQVTADYATIAGGGRVDPANPLLGNSVFDSYGSIGGGGNNRAGSDDGDPTSATYATVGGGGTNWATGQGATIGGGFVNEASGFAATVPGGDSNTASGDYSVVGGGLGNRASAKFATIAGGGRSFPDRPETGNRVTGDYGAVGGGGDNEAAVYATVAGGQVNAATGIFSNVGGGFNNDAGGWAATIAGGEYNGATGYQATVGGGFGNTASGDCAVVPGGNQNVAAGLRSFAAGYRAHANHNGAFVWGDSQISDVNSTAKDQVTFRCGGGVRFLSGGSGANQAVSWAPGDSSWTPSSDRNLKENFVEIDSKEVLERVSRLPITEWNFKGYALRHIGPVAQDFHFLFPLGGSDTRIDSGDLQGVSLAAIQGLHELLREKDAKVSTLEARIAALESLVAKLAERQAGGEE